MCGATCAHVKLLQQLALVLCVLCHGAHAFLLSASAAHRVSGWFHDSLKLWISMIMDSASIISRISWHHLRRLRVEHFMSDDSPETAMTDLAKRFVSWYHEHHLNWTLNPKPYNRDKSYKTQGGKSKLLMLDQLMGDHKFAVVSASAVHLGTYFGNFISMKIHWGGADLDFFCSYCRRRKF